MVLNNMRSKSLGFLIKGIFMTSLKFKRVYLLELVIAVTISLGIGSILGMKVFSHLYTLSSLQAGNGYAFK